MALGPTFTFPIIEASPVSNSQNYGYVVQDLRLRAISSNLAYIVQDLRTSAISNNLSAEVTAVTLGLIRDDQFQIDTITSDRFELYPLKILDQRNDVDFTTTNTFEIYTAPVQSIVLGVIAEVTNADTVTSPPEIAISSAGTTVLDNEPLVSFGANTSWCNWVAGGKSVSTAAAEVVSVVLTGATATELVGNIYILGLALE